MTSSLARWQRLKCLTDQQAANALGLSLGQFRKQKTAGPSRQTALLAILICLFEPDMVAIAAAAATLNLKRRAAG